MKGLKVHFIKKNVISLMIQSHLVIISDHYGGALDGNKHLKLVKNKLLLNELAPKPHNKYLYSSPLTKLSNHVTEYIHNYTIRLGSNKIRTTS